MELKRREGWDQGVYEVVLGPGERLNVHSVHGNFTVDRRDKDMNVFTIVEDENGIPERIEMGSFKDGKYKKAQG